MKAHGLVAGGVLHQDKEDEIRRRQYEYARVVEFMKENAITALSVQLGVKLNIVEMYWEEISKGL